MVTYPGTAGHFTWPVATEGHADRTSDLHNVPLDPCVMPGAVCWSEPAAGPPLNPQTLQQEGQAGSCLVQGRAREPPVEPAVPGPGSPAPSQLLVKASGMAGRAELPSPETETGPWAYGGEGGGVCLPGSFLLRENARPALPATPAGRTARSGALQRPDPGNEEVQTRVFWGGGALRLVRGGGRDREHRAVRSAAAGIRGPHTASRGV